jgi:hypothetical protein
MNPLMLLMAGAKKHTTYTLSGAIIFDVDTTQATCGIRVNLDGTIDKLQGPASYTQISSATDWVIPNAQSSVAHWVRFERISGDTIDFTGTLSTWQQLNANREINYDVNSVSIRSGIYSVEIALDSGGTNIVAGPVNYTITAEVSI